jgi:hypothetical protein
MVSDHFFHGWLDDIRIYNIALNTAQIDTLYHETVTKVEENPAGNKTINIYPNPSQGKFNINCYFDFKTLEVQTILGEKIFHFNYNKFGTNYEIDLSGYPKGVYLVKVNNGIKIYNKKIVIY